MIYSRKGDRALIKQINQQLVLHLIQGRGPISRKAITEISGLSPAAVSGITGTLIDRGLVQEVGEAEGAGRAGRRAVLLGVNPHAGYVVGVKLAVHTITCVLTDLDANVLRATTTPVPLPDGIGQAFPPAALIQTTIQAIEHLLLVAQINRVPLLGIGVGVNGLVDTKAGVSLLAPHFSWHNVPLAAPLAAYFGTPVHLENDARTLAIAEQWFGTGRGVDNFVAVALGHGIGAGVIANSQLYRGTGSGAGEFGHIVLQPDGPPCSCGKRGCVEALAAEPAILRQVREALAKGEPSLLAGTRSLTLEAVANAADAGDSLAQHVLGTAGQWLGLGMAAVVNVLSPALLIFNGEAVRAGRWYFEPMEAALHAHTFAGLADQLRIIIEPGGNEIWARGAACVVLSALFTALGPPPDLEPIRRLASA